MEFRELYEKVPLFSKLHELEGMVQFCSPFFLNCLTYGQDSELFVKKKKNQNEKKDPYLADYKLRWVRVYTF